MPQPLSKADKKELKKLGARFKAIREEKGLSQTDVAHAIGKDRQSISRLEQGDFNPSYLYMKQICEGLGVELSEVLG
ncbi:MAG: helix-turn-helix transcriptional regulator [Flavipsychrobacter sp.]